MYTKFQDCNPCSSLEKCDIKTLQTYENTKFRTEQIQFSPTFPKRGYNNKQEETDILLHDTSCHTHHLFQVSKF